MKKIFMLALVAMAGVAFAVAQPRAIGANLGGNMGFSYQHTLGANMIDLTLGFPFAHDWDFGFRATCTYDWIDPFNATVPWNEKGEWHWYMGVGAGAGFYGINVSGENFLAATVGAVGHFGIEYDFWFPLQLSLDYRPSIGVAVNKNDCKFDEWGFYGISLGVRYLF